MVDEGCVLSNCGHCDKYNVECMGSFYAKRRCPTWAEALAIEKYYKEKLIQEMKCKTQPYSIG